MGQTRLKDGEDLFERPYFATTHWSVVLAARDGAATQAQSALDTLCRTYWYPLYAYVRRRGLAPEDAEDITQSFFGHWLNHDFLSNVGPEKGRFRSFILVCIKRYLTDEWRKQGTTKRGGGKPMLSWDEQDAEGRYLREPVDVNDAEALYERRWALTLLERVLGNLEQEFLRAGKQAMFAELQPCLLGEATDSSYRETGARLGITEGAVRMTVLRMRRRYRELFREEIAHTVSEPGEIEGELRYVVSVLSR